MTSVLAQRLFSSSRSTIRTLGTNAYSRSRLLSSAYAPTRYASQEAAPKAASAPTPTNEPVASAAEHAPTPLDSMLPHAIGSDGATDWSRSYHGLSSEAFAPEVAEILLAPLEPADIEIKPGGFSCTSLSE